MLICSTAVAKKRARFLKKNIFSSINVQGVKKCDICTVPGET